MSISNQIVGYTGPPFKHRLDERWSMAFAAGIGDSQQNYFDNSAGQVLRTHPLFPVCVEWPSLVKSMGDNAIDMRRTVHATHDLHIIQPLHPSCEITTTATIIGLEQRKPGVYLGWRLDSRDEHGSLLSQTWQGNLFLGEQLNGSALWVDDMPVAPTRLTTENRSVRTLSLSANLAHVYTECARIWNPIHTDLAVANAAGIDTPLLHGTATLALAVSEMITSKIKGRSDAVTRIGGRFSAMVMLPSTLELEMTQSDSLIQFTVRNADGKAAISDGYLAYS